MPERFTASVELLEDAFDYSYQPNAEGYKVSWRDCREGSCISFYGEQTLADLLDNNYLNVLPGRRNFYGEPDSLPTSDVRLEFQRYAVVGRRVDAEGNVDTHRVIFHAGDIAFLEGRNRPLANVPLRPMELVRLRSGLMNRRQASLLVNHLNRFRRNHHQIDTLTWSVIRGPLPNSSARDWLDAVAGSGEHLQHTAGETLPWGLGLNASKALTLYVVIRSPSVNREQVFAYCPPRYILPPRFAISVRERIRSPSVQTGQNWHVTRRTEDASASALAAVCEEAGLLGCEGPSEFTRAEDFWGPEDEGYPDYAGYEPTPSQVYATSFSRDEAIRAMRVLRMAGYRDIKARRVGADGDFSRVQSGHSCFGQDEVSCHHTLIVPGRSELEIEVSTFSQVQDKYTSWEKREEWEREALTTLWEKRKAAATARQASLQSA